MSRFLSIIFVFILISSSAQQNSDPVFTLKPTIGLSGCQVHGDTYDGFDKIGFGAGIAVNARINKRASFELGFNYADKGSRHIPKPDKGDYSYYRLNMNCIDMPLSFRYMLNSKYFFTAGPYLAFLINHSENINYINYTNNYQYNRFELGLNVGLGRNIGEKFSIEFRASNSITPVRSFYNNTYYPNPVARFFNKGYYNNIITLFVAYKLDVKKSAKN